VLTYNKLIEKNLKLRRNEKDLHLLPPHPLILPLFPKVALVDIEKDTNTRKTKNKNTENVHILLQADLNQRKESIEKENNHFQVPRKNRFLNLNLIQSL